MLSYHLPEKFEHMKKTGDYYVVVVEDTTLGQIVATATLITEHKFIHSCAKVTVHYSHWPFQSGRLTQTTMLCRHVLK